MRRLRGVDLLLLVTLVPVFLVVLTLHLREAVERQRADLPLFATVPWGGGDYPIVGGYRPEAERVDPARPGQVGAPFRGVVNVSVAVGDEVAAGDTVAIIEAMKMESSISATVDGTVERIAAQSGASLEGGDLILEIRPSGLSGSPETDIEN